MNQSIRILAVTRKQTSASFEQRIANYVQPLRAHDIHVTPRPLPHSWSGQWQALAEAKHYDGVWWHRHLLSPLLLPRLRLCARRLLFEYDDPLTYSARAGGRPSLVRRIRFAAMLKRCDAALAGSSDLAELARPYCQQVVIHPMAVDLPEAVPDREPADKVELLWLGSRATQPYLELIRPALEQLEVTLRLVAHESMTFGSIRVDFRPWSPQEQNAALRQCHLGLCPMPDTPWTRGKCPYKVLQYMAYGMPWVGSAVGENLVTCGIAPGRAAAGAGHDWGGGTRGLCAATTEQWLNALRRLIDDHHLRRRMGQAGRIYVEREHNRSTLTKRLALVMRQVINPPAS